MDQLPNEVITHIFQLLPQRYRSILSIVCKKWKYILTQPIFFNALDIYSIRQLKKYIEMGKEKLINDDLPLGYSVKRVHFYTNHLVHLPTLIDMVDSFPNLHSIQGSFTILNNGKYHVNRLQHLNFIPFWYQNNSNRWLYIIQKHPHQIRSLEFTLTLPILLMNTNQQEQQLSSSLPVIYFHPSTPYERRSHSHIQSFNSTLYKIYDISLPILSSLTHLTINCDMHGGDERMFESIHQSCPQLYSLNLELFNMHIFDDGNSIEIKLQSNLQLKLLSISGYFHNSKCFDYLSMKYPHLESLSLIFNSRPYQPTSFSSIRSSIYNLITQYKHLNRLAMKSESEKFQFQVWPHAELLYWLKQNPSQLSHLEYNYIFIDTIIREYENLRNTVTFSQPATLFFNEDIFFQSHDYLNHISSLSIGIDPYISTHILYYFYIFNKDSTFISSTIKELKIHTFIFGNINFWLTAFPNLDSLSITGRGVLTVINDDDGDDELYDKVNNMGDRNFFKSNYQFIKKKMNWVQQQQQKSINQSVTIPDHQHLPFSYYKLKKLELKNCIVDFKRYGWNGFFKHFNDLKTIRLIDINPLRITQDNTDTNDPVQQATFDLSHLSLDLLEINSINYYHYVINSHIKHFVKELSIKETSFNNSYYIGYENEYKNSSFHYKDSTTLNVICKSIDNIVFDQEL